MNPRLTYRGTTAHDHVAVCDWCYANCGEFNKGWYRLGTDPISVVMADITDQEKPRDIYYFANQHMLTLFLLRWS